MILFLKWLLKRHFEKKKSWMRLKKAKKEMLQNGIIAIGDICNNTLTVSQKIKKNLRYYNFVEISGWLPEIASVRFEREKIFLMHFEKHDLKSSIVPHAPYSVSENLWNEMIPFFTEKQSPFITRKQHRKTYFFWKEKEILQKCLR